MLRTHIAVLATLIIARCGEPATAPPVPASVDLAVRIVTADVVEVRAVATNYKPRPVYYAEGCGAEDGIWFDVIAPNGRLVWVTPPGLPPACASREAALAPQAHLESSWVFDGTLYDAQGSAYPAPDGRYVVVAHFRWWQAPGSREAIVLEQRAAWHWNATASSR